MSVFVKNMIMTRDCRKCRLMEFHCSTGETRCAPADGLLAEDFRPIPFDGRPEWCPLVEIPEKHGRLIDADALMNIFADRLEKMPGRYGINSAVAGAVSGAMKLLDVQPTVIEAEDEE